MKRREFIALLSAAMWPLSALAQQRPKTARIGMLVGLAESDPAGQLWVRAFLEALGLDNRSVKVDLRWGAADVHRMELFAKELVASHPDVIQVSTTPGTAAVLRETSAIPVVFTVVSDPVGWGFVESLARPGKNATGFINIEASLGGKWVELLKEIAPHVSTVAMLFNPSTSPQADYYRESLEAAAGSRGLAVLTAAIQNSTDIEETIRRLGDGASAGLIVIPGTLSAAHRELIVRLSTQHRVPSVYPFESFARAGGLLSYGIDQVDLHRRAAGYVDKILRGVSPNDLPVQQPTKFDLIINLKTAKALGIAIPQSLLLRADEVIE